MRALQDFVATDDGLMSLAAIVVILGMGMFFSCCVSRHIKEDTEAAERATRL